MRSRRGRRGRIWLPDPLSDHPLNTGLVGCWDGLTNDPFIGGSMARDIALHRNHGTLVNGTTWEPGPYGGYGFGFVAASSQRISNPGPSVTADLTVSCWIRLTSVSSFPLILGKGAGSNNLDYNYICYTSSNLAVRCAIGDGTNQTIATTTTINLLEWTHVVFTADGDTLQTYINGRPNVSATQTTVLTANAHPLLIGGVAGFGFVNGQIAYPRVYNRALSAAEVSALYLQQQQGSPDLYNWVSSKTYSIPSGAPTGSPWYYYLQEQLLAG